MVEIPGLSIGNNVMIFDILNNIKGITPLPINTNYGDGCGHVGNTCYDIIFQNNKNIIVYDKILKRFYINLKVAHQSIFNNYP